MYRLNSHGKKLAEDYIRELEAKRKEILDAGKDTADDTNLPTVKDIEDDLNFFDIDDEGEYYNGWGVTDNYDADYPLLLKRGRDFVVLPIWYNLGAESMVRQIMMFGTDIKAEIYRIDKDRNEVILSVRYSDGADDTHKDLVEPETGLIEKEALICFKYTCEEDDEEGLEVSLDLKGLKITGDDCLKIIEEIESVTIL